MARKFERLFFGTVTLLCLCGSESTPKSKPVIDFIFPDKFELIQGLATTRHQRSPQGFGQIPQQQQFFPQQQQFFPQQQQFFPTQPTSSNSQPPTSPPTPNTNPSTQPPNFQNCVANCPTTPEYNPICGTDRQLYFNEQKFNCAKNCGAQVEIWRRGSCEGLFTMTRG